jgi:hypothetical protein
VPPKSNHFVYYFAKTGLRSSLPYIFGVMNFLCMNQAKNRFCAIKNKPNATIFLPPIVCHSNIIIPCLLDKSVCNMYFALEELFKKEEHLPTIGSKKNSGESSTNFLQSEAADFFPTFPASSGGGGGKGIITMGKGRKEWAKI